MRVLERTLIKKSDFEEWKKNRTLHSYEREQKLNLFTEDNDPVDAFMVYDNDNRIKIHVITKQAQIYVFGMVNHEFVTVFNERPRRLFRYYDAMGERTPYELKQNAYRNLEKGYNNM